MSTGDPIQPIEFSMQWSKPPKAIRFSRLSEDHRTAIKAEFPLETGAGKVFDSMAELLAAFYSERWVGTGYWDVVSGFDVWREPSQILKSTRRLLAQFDNTSALTRFILGGYLEDESPTGGRGKVRRPTLLEILDGLRELVRVADLDAPSYSGRRGRPKVRDEVFVQIGDALLDVWLLEADAEPSWGTNVKSLRRFFTAVLDAAQFHFSVTLVAAGPGPGQREVRSRTKLSRRL